MKKFLAFLICISILIVSVGCGKQAGPAQGGDSEEPNAGGDEYKEEAVIGMHAQLTTVDPQALSNIQHNMLFKTSHDRLVRLETETLKIYPELATDWEWVTETELEMKLRDDVIFHNGNPMTADDVIFTLIRAKEGGTTAAAKFTGLEKIEKIDEYTIKMVLDSPNVDWIDTLSLPMCSILNKEAVEADELEGAGIGTGAWVVKDFGSGDSVFLERNEDYWGELPETKKLVLRHIPEESARLIALENGEIDLAINISNTELGLVSDNPDLELVQFQSTTCTYIAFNTSKAPGNNKNLRLAVAHAINVDDIIEGAVEGYGTKANTFWGLATYGYYDDFDEPYEYNPEKAKEYLALAGYPDGGVDIEFSTSSAARVLGLQIMQAQLKEVGINLKINELDGAGLTSLTAFKTAGHEAMTYSIGWNTAGDDSRRLFYENSNTNKATYTNQHVMDLLDKAVAEFDDTKRKAMYQEIQQITHDEAPYIALYNSIQNIAINKNLTGVIVEPHQSHDFKYVKVSK